MLAEVRRLLPKNRWTWLAEALRQDSWAGLIACYFIDDSQHLPRLGSPSRRL